MAIKTIFGSDIEVLSPADGEGWVKIKRKSDGIEREYHASQLRCDTSEELQALFGDNEVSK